MADCSDSKTIREAFARMPEGVKEQLTTEDGRIVGVPACYSLMPFTWNPEAWDAAGLPRESAPESYGQLLDFLEDWLRRGGRPGVCVCGKDLIDWSMGKAAYSEAYWLMELLLTTWELQQTYAGEAIGFDTEAFAELAARTREVGLALHDAQPKRRDDLPELLISGLKCAGEHMLLQRFDCVVPMRLTPDQPKLVRANLIVDFLREGSAWREAGIAYLEHTLTQRTWPDAFVLFEDAQPAPGLGLEVTQEWLDAYRRFDAIPCFVPSVWNLAGERETKREAAMLRFFEGKTDAQGFARALDEAIR